MSIEYLTPEDRYDIEVFNRNFRQVETALNSLPPLDWLNLPDLSDLPGQKICMLLLIGPDMCNKMVFNLQTAQVVPNIIIDWGDGSTTSAASVTANASSYFYAHEYNYAALDAPTTIEGYKQVILTVEDVPGEDATALTYFSVSAYSSGETRLLPNYALLRKIAIQAGASQNLQISVSSNYLLQSIVAHNIKSLSATICEELREIEVTGENCTGISTSYAQLSYLTVPDNAYTSFSMTNMRMEALSLNLANFSTTVNASSVLPSFSNSRSLRRLKLNGLRRGFQFSYAPMTRAAIVELFESLGQADMTLSAAARTINLTTLPAYPELTAADKAIATGKGFVVP